MSAADLSELRTEDLIEHFIVNARRVGPYLEVPDGMGSRDPRAPAIREEMRAIARELIARKDLIVLRRLYDHPSNNVRTWAAGQFGSTDPDWASAGINGLPEGLTATEVMAYRKRALQKPPQRPTVAEMSTDELVAYFEDACIRYYASRFFSDEKGLPDVKLHNRIVTEIVRIVGELEARNALDKLLPLLDHENSMVRCDAAAYCLPIASERAVPILEGYIRDAPFSPEYHRAWDALRNWRKKQKGATPPGA